MVSGDGRIPVADNPQFFVSGFMKACILSALDGNENKDIEEWIQMTYSQKIVMLILSSSVTVINWYITHEYSIFKYQNVMVGNYRESVSQTSFMFSGSISSNKKFPATMHLNVPPLLINSGQTFGYFL